MQDTYGKHFQQRVSEVKGHVIKNILTLVILI